MARRYLHTTIQQDKKYFEETRDIYLHTILPKLLGDVEAGIEEGICFPSEDDRLAQFCEIIKMILKDPSLYQLISVKMTQKEIRWKVRFPRTLLSMLGPLSNTHYGNPGDSITIVFQLKRWHPKREARDREEWETGEDLEED